MCLEDEADESDGTYMDLWSPLMKAQICTRFWRVQSVPYSCFSSISEFFRLFREPGSNSIRTLCSEAKCHNQCQAIWYRGARRGQVSSHRDVSCLQAISLLGRLRHFKTHLTLLNLNEPIMHEGGKSCWKNSKLRTLAMKATAYSVPLLKDVCKHWSIPDWNSPSEWFPRLDISESNRLFTASSNLTGPRESTPVKKQRRSCELILPADPSVESRIVPTRVSASSVEIANLAPEAGMPLDLSRKSERALETSRQSGDSEIMGKLKGVLENGNTMVISGIAEIKAIDHERCIFRACPSLGCKKKLEPLGSGSYRCNECNRTSEKFEWRLLLEMTLQDDKGCFVCTAFNEVSDFQ